mmetsp:Transcript_12094/g.56119  ORF Transcript_12094/g.56119 Transcript_12094/m.56119 type:complete len:265 (-) Transcript_12094:858-1652(-)
MNAVLASASALTVSAFSFFSSIARDSRALVAGSHSRAVLSREADSSAYNSGSSAINSSHVSANDLTSESFTACSLDSPTAESSRAHNSRSSFSPWLITLVLADLEAALEAAALALSLASTWAPGGRLSVWAPSHRVDDASTRSVESFASSRAYRAVVAAAATHRSATAHRRRPAYPSTTVRAIESAAMASFDVEFTQHSPVWKSVRCFLAHATELGVSVSSATARAFSRAFSDAALAIAFFFVASLAILAMDVSTSTASTSSST